MGQRVVVVTDSAAMLSAEEAEANRIVVAPLTIIVAGEALREGEAGTEPAEVAAALAAKRPVSTSRPAPAELGLLYQRLADEGATAVVSVHLSAEMSGTVESAQLAARDAPLEVVPVDTRVVGPGLGLAALAAAQVAAAGGSAEEAAAAALARAGAATTYFYVDTLEYLRRGGRIGPAAALLGSALAVKPLLAIDEGRVVARERVRTSVRAIARLEELAVEAAGSGPVEAWVAHLTSPERAAELRDHLAARFGDRLRGEVRSGELPAALAAHVGPGMLAVCVAPAVDDA
ncbi:MAG TPA: DegV family protein [Nocardioides sp.]|uniref:DegV family protein n=1 Tax=Nocardioides sp. TaxID=35761 RepID=UPI002EDB918F